MEKSYNKDYSNLNKLIENWYIKSDKQKKDININEDIKEFKYNYEPNYYKNKIFYSLSENILDELDLDIEFCNDSLELLDLWNYLQFVSSSHTISENTFRIIKILLKDKKTNKYLGLIELSTDFYSLKDRDDYIGWSEDIKKYNLKYIAAISTCVGLQPMCHNLNIGKLLSIIAFSKEVNEYFYSKFGYYYVGVSTTSLYGKSIQYDRLKELKLVGYTKGYGTSQIPDYLYEEMIKFLKKYYVQEYSNLKKKFRKVGFISKIFGYSNDLLYHGQKRGIYFGYVNDKSKDFLHGKTSNININNLRSVEDIINWWKERWARNRWNNLYNNKLLKIKYELKNMTKQELLNEYIRQYNYYNYHHNEKFNENIKLKNKNNYLKNRELKNKVDISINKRKLNFNQIIEILEWKIKKKNNEKFFDNKMISHKKISEYLSEKFNINITEQMIKYYWNGTTLLHEEEFKIYYDINEYKIKYDEYKDLVTYY